MNIELRALMTIALVLAACDEGTTDLGQFDDSGCEAPATEDSAGGGEPVPLAVDCSIHWDGVTQSFRFEATDDVSGDADPPLAFGPMLVGARLFDDEYDGRSFSISVYKEDGSVGAHTLYQMDRTVRPVNEFWGDHGFTGLNSVSDPDTNEGIQYACFASDPADPIHAWED